MGGIDRILEAAAKLGKGQSGSRGGGSQGKDPSDPGDPQQRNRMKGQEEKKDPLQDNKPGGTGKPDSPEKAKSPEEAKGKTPPSTSEKRTPNARDVQGVFFAQLPAKVREAVDNGDFDQVPEKYRDIIREWTKALAEKDKREKKDE